VQLLDQGGAGHKNERIWAVLEKIASAIARVLETKDSFMSIQASEDIQPLTSMFLSTLTKLNTDGTGKETLQN
jgi:hypothetical protein